MPFSYQPLWDILYKQKMSRRELARRTHMSLNTLYRMGKNDYISLKWVDAICTELHCTPNDIMEHIPSEREPE